jgi:hypothetical protein
MRSIGWLGPEYGMQGGVSICFAQSDRERLGTASGRIASPMLGMHECEFCPRGSGTSGNGEYHYYMSNGDIYCAPVMILHYIDVHGYRPPEVFLESLRATDSLSWDWRAERLAGLLLDGTGDFDFRCEAAIDMANWKDIRSFDALKSACRDDFLADLVGEDLGYSLGTLLSCGPPYHDRIDDLSPRVKRGIEMALRGLSDLRGGPVR